VGARFQRARTLLDTFETCPHTCCTIRHGHIDCKFPKQGAYVVRFLLDGVYRSAEISQCGHCQAISIDDEADDRIRAALRREAQFLTAEEIR